MAKSKDNCKESGHQNEEYYPYEGGGDEIEWNHKEEKEEDKFTEEEMKRLNTIPGCDCNIKGCCESSPCCCTNHGTTSITHGSVLDDPFLFPKKEENDGTSD